MDQNGTRVFFSLARLDGNESELWVEGGDGEAHRWRRGAVARVQGGCGGSPRPPLAGGDTNGVRERQRSAVYWEHGVELLGHREGEGRRGDVWEVPGAGADLFREKWRLYIGGRGSMGRGDLRREHGRCQLTEERGGRGFRRGAVDGCRNLLARLQAAGWCGGSSRGARGRRAWGGPFVWW
jgi:hypothetical protein